MFFFSLIGYSGVRSATTALFLQKYGSGATPLWNLYSVITLTCVVSAYNWIQKKLGARVIFFLNATLTVVLFLLGTRSQWWGSNFHVGPLYVWKEVHVVVFIHLGWAYLINTLRSETASTWFGPVAAIASLGGTLGGLLVSYSMNRMGIPAAMGWISAAYLIAAAFFLRAPLSDAASAEHGTKRSPVASLKEVRHYVAYLAAFIALSQVVIGILEFLFYRQLDGALSSAEAKTQYLGDVNAWMNGLSLVFKVTLVPWLMARFRAPQIQFGLPLTYALLSFGMLPGMGGASAVALMTIAVAYAVVKGSDYSVMSVCKEMLYYPLASLQRYGAKYVSDIWVYRLAKALASFVLIWVQAEGILFGLLLVTLLVWGYLGYRLARAPEPT